ncbi:unnamed protein product [Phytophthora lilii]|uniref:Unnamed protein product n=1 Tax=Phytophthora lilii TaxID=2077276 RepID=A0A9W6WVJ5_9STRA|nr:unnamed protein product [Phytophthora lilii]
MTCTHRYDGNANDCDICIDITMGFDPIEPAEAFNEFDFPDGIHHEFFNMAVDTFDNHADKWRSDVSYRFGGPSDRTNVFDYLLTIESFMAQLYATRPFMGNEGLEIRTSLL